MGETIAGFMALIGAIGFVILLSVFFGLSAAAAVLLFSAVVSGEAELYVEAEEPSADEEKIEKIDKVA